MCRSFSISPSRRERRGGLVGEDKWRGPLQELAIVRDVLIEGNVRSKVMGTGKPFGGVQEVFGRFDVGEFGQWNVRLSSFSSPP